MRRCSFEAVMNRCYAWVYDPPEAPEKAWCYYHDKVIKRKLSTGETYEDITYE